MLYIMKIKQILPAVCLMACSLSLSFSNIASATSTNKCAGVATAIIKCSQTSSCADGSVPDNDNKCADGTTAANVKLEDSGIWHILQLAINILTAGVGVAAVGGVIYGSIIYMTASGSADKTKKGISIITNVAIGIACWALMYAALSYIIPGGVFD